MVTYLDVPGSNLVYDPLSGVFSLLQVPPVEYSLSILSYSLAPVNGEKHK
jgi:hypothetical protein